MSTFRRYVAALVVLGIGLALQAALLAHLHFGPGNVYAPVKKPFSELPFTLSASAPKLPAASWTFVTLPDEAIERKKLPYVALDMLFRRGRSPQLGNLEADLFLIHTDNGEDRKHHPEICMRDVQQIPEDVSARAVLNLGGDPNRPVQRYSFVSGSRVTTIYYWHYTFLPDLQQGQSKLQAAYQAVGQAPPSVTIQLTTSAPRANWPLVEALLVEPLERKLRDEHLPANVKMQCDRLPIGLVER